MSGKKFIAVYSSVLLLTLATGTVWANAPIGSTVKISLGHRSEIFVYNGAALGNTMTYCPRVASFRTTASLDDALPQNNARATQDVLVATVEINLLSQNPGARSTRDLSVVWPVPRRASPLPANENSTYSTFARTGAFGGAEERVTMKRPEGQVQTGVFWTPRGFSGRARGDSPANALKSGFLGIPSDPGVEHGTGERHGVQGRQLRKRGSKSGIWRGL